MIPGRLQKFLPKTNVYNKTWLIAGVEECSLPQMVIEDTGDLKEKLAVFGITMTKWGFTLGRYNGCPITWGRERIDKLGGKVYFEAQPYNDEERRLITPRCDGPISDLLSDQHWENCYHCYSAKFETAEEGFIEKSLDYRKLKELDSPEMKTKLSENERKALRNLYHGRLEKDPTYLALCEAKEDVDALEKYIHERKEQRRRQEERIRRQEKRERYKRSPEYLRELMVADLKKTGGK